MLKFTHWLALVVAIAGFVNAEAPEVKRIQVKEIEIAYYKRGEGKPLLMINGYKSTLASWDPLLLDDLEKNLQLILFDNRGVGLSSDTSENHTTIEQMADDAAALATALGYEKVYVLGWSMGARIAQQLAIRHPEVVEKLILCAPNPGGSHQVVTSPEAAKKLSDQNLTPIESLELFYAPTPEGKQEANNYFQRLKNGVIAKTIPDDFQVKPETIERQDGARGKPWNDSNANFEALSQIKLPVLVTGGQLDVVDLPGNVKVIANQIPFAWTAYFDGGHAFLFQDHERFAKLVRVFLDD